MLMLTKKQDTTAARRHISSIDRGRYVRSRRLVAAVAATVAAWIVIPAAAIAAPSLRSWLAAGDSYTSGEGLPHATGNCARALPGSGSENWLSEGDLG